MDEIDTVLSPFATPGGGAATYWKRWRKPDVDEMVCAAARNSGRSIHPRSRRGSFPSFVGRLNRISASCDGALEQVAIPA